MQNVYPFFFAAAGQAFPLYFTLVYAVGFVAAVSLGLVAFFNSKRPTGWETAKRPDLIPDLQSTKSQDKD
ncbi:hypothetical protein FLX56_25185 [Synechococcus moorigangaii CMS01]|nr:hypothetical protein [Synechococcus moorigangaii CMS01]